MSERSASRLLFVALDAMELSIADQLMADGRMPVLAELKRKGASATSRSSADWFVASPWPTFYTSTSPAEHALYHYLHWDPLTMRSRRPQADHKMARPFWRSLEKNNLNSVVIDAPMVFPPPSGGTGIEICGWCTHDVLADPWIYPPSVARRVESIGLKPVVLREPYHLLDRREVGFVHRQLNLSTDAIRDLALQLLRVEPWNFGLVSFTAPHMAAHQFWSDTSLSSAATSAETRGARRILEDVYTNCDEAVGRLIESVPPDTTVMVTALHGFGANTNRGDLLPQMLRMILAESGAAKTEPFNLLKSARNLLPQRVRQAAKGRLPRRWQDALTGFWRSTGQDWSSTKAFAFVPDLQGFIRINLAGRERDGIVQAGAQYDELCEQIMAGLMQFVDADTNAPIVNETVRIDQLFSNDPGVHRLPDIAVNWSQAPCAEHREITSPFGSIAWPSPGKNFDGRSGNHLNRGFLIAQGPGIAPGKQVFDVDIVDYAPTIFDFFNVPSATHFQGKSILDQLRPRKPS